MSIAGGLHLAFERGEKAGCETIQIFSKSPNQWQSPPLTEQQIADFKNAQQKTGIAPVICHDSYLINLASADQAANNRSREAFLDEMQRCEALAIPLLVMHPGSHLGEGVEAGISRVVESFDWLHQQTDSSELKVLLETTAGQGTNLGWQFAQIGEIISRVQDSDRLGVCIDSCHIHAAGYDITSRDGYEKTIQDFDTEIGLDKLMAFHLNDSKKAFDSRVDRHDHIGVGSIGLDAFSFLLNDERLAAVPMVLETPKGKDGFEDLENLAVLRGLINE
jgi:deoxyribonuclease-4